MEYARRRGVPEDGERGGGAEARRMASRIKDCRTRALDGRGRRWNDDDVEVRRTKG